MGRLSWRKKVGVGLAALVVVGAASLLPTVADAHADIQTVKSSVKGADGKDYWVENHLDSAAIKQSTQAVRAAGKRPEYLLVWAGDENAADTAVSTVKGLPGSVKGADQVKNALPGPDFLAVIDATKGSPTYGKVVNTGVVGPLVENEPHHMQYAWHKGDRIYAGGLFSAATYVFDVTKLPALSITGISLPNQTPCGSVPDAFWVLKDHTAYGTYMGGPVAPGPCRYTNGEVRSGNGFAGTPGEVVRFGPDAKNLVEAPAATTTPEDPAECLNMPALSSPTCANPHGIQVREDLNTLVTSDYAEPRTIILDPVKAPSPTLRRTTVRTWDISDRNHPQVKSVSYLPNGPRTNPADPLHSENRAAMETTVTNLPGHKGAFVETMQGGSIFYTPDITKKDPKWQKVYDDTTSNKFLDPGGKDTGVGDNGGWLQTSPDDKTLYHAVIGRTAGTLGKNDKGTAGGVISIDISKLVASGDNPRCVIDTVPEISNGGAESDCPTPKSQLATSGSEIAGGPHWGALDNFAYGSDGYYHETDEPSRMATSDYFVARTGLDGDHRVCVEDIDKDGKLSLDKDFKDEVTGQPCVNFNRQNWPHGPVGDAKPHAILFATPDDAVK